MANGTSGHESEFINVQDLKAALQKFKTDKVDVKVDKVTGKGLSTNDYTTNEKNKLSGIATGATKVTTDTVSGWGYTKNAGTVTGVKINGTTKSPSSGVVDLGTVITSHQDISGKVNTTTTVNGHALSSNVTVTKSDVGLGNVGNFKAVSTVASQGLSNTEKANARANIGAGTSSFSGNYNDLSNKPTIPSVSQSTGTSTTAVMSQKAVTDYVQSVLVNPISDSSILVNTVFSPRDVISVDGEMYMADAETSDLPKTNPVVQDNKVVTQDGKVVLGLSSTTSADWHSF